MALSVGFAALMLVGSALMAALFDRRAEAAESGRRESQELLRQVIDSSGDGILVATADGAVRLCNPAAAAALLGQDAEKVIGQPLSGLVAGLTVPEPGAPSARLEATLPRAGGDAEVELVISRMEHAGATMTVCVLHDVSLRKQTEAAYAAAAENAERANRAKSNFLAMMSHEIRTPMNGVTANAMKGDREKCLEAGMDDYIAKPVNTQEFLQKIAQWAQVSRTRRTSQPAQPEPDLKPTDAAS